MGRLGYTEWHCKMIWPHTHNVQRRINVLFKHYGSYALFTGRIMWVIHPMAAGVFGMRTLTFDLVDLTVALLWLLLYLGVDTGWEYYG